MTFRGKVIKKVSYYSIELLESTVSISETNAIELMKHSNECIEHGQLKCGWIDLDNTIRACESEDFNEFMNSLGYIVGLDAGEWYIDDYIFSELPDPLSIFEVLAEFIDDGYIQFRGGDGVIWTYIFESGKCEEVTGEV